ncbi:V-type proton ATPase subunit E [Trichoplax sp. H2]|uniref:V-type proton ATPase subunit E n=1 Tax=Trichoplax adhaerens TaxID=10228 RepID=B3RT30_TRIAD|nr:expressed hypothetical protein [Trichoplax adhaerens]EDV27157.1 expressed hypothetical protein [Trichoplax adhaerens]RDD45723.1 V-type proton ATPase subunit E [Trichoplax sp. H2]|eukprot:XP_002111153.1 expressed hypothetical protein [Trichoplax adhaerens]
MALSDTEVQKQIHHMMAFIEQEAKEKADEIDAKAEEEFNIEKSRLVQQEKLKILGFYEKKEKQIELQRKIQHSNMLNQSRLAILKERENLIKAIMEDTRVKLGAATKDQEKYKGLLQGLITQGLFQLLEKTVIVRCRQADLKLIKEVIGDAVKDYKNASKRDIVVNVDIKEFLGSEISGGVELLTPSGNIKISNTLESRLESLYRQMLPEIRTTLFGANEGRRFTD